MGLSSNLLLSCRILCYDKSMNKRTKKKKTRAKKIELKKLTKNQKIVFAAACMMAVCVIFLVYMSLGKYNGLGIKMPIKDSPYNLTQFVLADGQPLYEDEDYKSVTGIDVSEFQGEIDWKAVKDEGIDFAMIRLGFRGSESGKLVLDSRFKKNLKGAKRAGLDVGVYFFSQAITPEEAIEEARYVLKHIRGKGVNYPVAFDMEPIDGTERAAKLTKQQKTEAADAFCQVIDRNGRTPMVYGNPQWLNKHIDRSYLTEYGTWLAHYIEITGYSKDYMMWQYTDSGSVNGISGPVDMNLYFYEK